MNANFDVPWMPPAEIVTVEGRGEFFVRIHRHPDPTRPIVLLMHGWTASSDLQFFSAYPAMASEFSFIGIDHLGHGRGVRRPETFALDVVADDAAAVTRALGATGVIAVGYSMGGPVAMTLARRHPDLVAGLVVQATALEWRATWRERLTWRWLPVLGAALRSWTYPRLMKRSLERMLDEHHPYVKYIPWLRGEIQRGEPKAIIDAGRALSEHDARPWASSLGMPSGSLITTRDRLVRPSKQRELANALSSTVREIPTDHLGPWEQPDQFASATVELVSIVAANASSS